MLPSHLRIEYLRFPCEEAFSFARRGAAATP